MPDKDPSTNATTKQVFWEFSTRIRGQEYHQTLTLNDGIAALVVKTALALRVVAFVIVIVERGV